jgi:hypothetical protein
MPQNRGEKFGNRPLGRATLLPDSIAFPKHLTTTLFGCSWVQHSTPQVDFLVEARSPALR